MRRLSGPAPRARQSGSQQLPCAASVESGFRWSTGPSLMYCDSHQIAVWARHEMIDQDLSCRAHKCLIQWSREYTDLLPGVRCRVNYNDVSGGFPHALVSS